MIYSSWYIECDRLKLVIMCHFLPFYPHKNAKKSDFWKDENKLAGVIIILHNCTTNRNHQNYVPEIQSETHFLVIFGKSFALLTPNTLKNQNFEKIKKASGDVIILYKCTKNHDHMMYASWDMEYNQRNFSSFWVIFYHLTPLLIPKIISWKNLNKTWRYKILSHIYDKQRSWCMVPEI